MISRKFPQKIAFWILKMLRLFCGPAVIKMNFTLFAKLVSAHNVLRLLGATVGERARISSDIILYNFGSHYCENLFIGNNVFIGPGCLFDLSCEIRINDDVSISPQVTFLTHLDVGDQPLQRICPKRLGPIEIEQGAWVGARSTILDSVTVGRFAMVGAMSLVNRNVPPLCLVAGTPFRVIRSYPDPTAKLIQSDTVCCG